MYESVLHSFSNLQLTIVFFWLWEIGQKDAIFKLVSKCHRRAIIEQTLIGTSHILMTTAFDEIRHSEKEAVTLTRFKIFILSVSDSEQHFYANFIMHLCKLGLNLITLLGAYLGA